MPDALSVQGAEQLAELGKQLKALGGHQLRAELAREMSHATDHLRDEVAKSARSTLPGDLGDWVAGLGIVTKTYTSGANVGVRIVGTKNKAATRRHRVAGVAARRGISTRAAGKLISSGQVTVGRGIADLNAIDRGRVKHPTYGRRPWVLQMVTPGFFTKPMHGPVAFEARLACLKVIDRMKERLSRGSAAA